MHTGRGRGRDGARGRFSLPHALPFWRGLVIPFWETRPGGPRRAFLRPLAHCATDFAVFGFFVGLFVGVVLGAVLR